MKRALVIILIIAACVAGFLSIRGTMPFMAILGNSMEPELKAGELIITKEVSPSQVKVGDIIVFRVHRLVQESYHYPPVVAHRVINLTTFNGKPAFRTKGDNAGEDPFTVPAQDLRGEVSQQIPYLGFPLLFMQSDQGLIFIIVALSLLTLYLYTDELSRGWQTMQRRIFAPVIEESRRSSQVLEQRMETTEKGMEGTQQALNNFASAMMEYAQHLQSHTSAIINLSEASQELKKGAAEQNKVLIHLMEIMEQAPPRKEEAIPKVERVEFPPGCIRSRHKPP